MHTWAAFLKDDMHFHSQIGPHLHTETKEKGNSKMEMEMGNEYENVLRKSKRTGTITVDF